MRDSMRPAHGDLVSRNMVVRFRINQDSTRLLFSLTSALTV